MNTHEQSDLLGETNLFATICYSARVRYLPSTICLLGSAAAPLRGPADAESLSGWCLKADQSQQPPFNFASGDNETRAGATTKNNFYLKLLSFFF